MIARLPVSRPLRFVAAISAGWIGVRATALLLPLPFLATMGPHLLPGRGHFPLEVGLAAGDLPPAPRPWPEPTFVADAPPAPRGPLADPAERASLAALGHLSAMPAGTAIARDANETWAVAAEAATRSVPSAIAPVTPSELASIPTLPAHEKHWSGSAWLFVRDGSGRRALAAGGQLGGSQAGARLAYRPLPDLPVAAYLRGSTALGGVRQSEAALGVDWQPFLHIPLRFGIERRIAIDRGGRNAFAALVAGGIYDQKFPLGTRLDGYAEAGVVGFRRGDLFVDGGVRVGRPIPLRKGASVVVGGGLWGAAQPHVARVDAGPQATLHLPIGRTGVSAAADWRFRIAGHAHPGSGPALTIGADF